ncbi:50S ribosomal protein L31 [Patescibacteria group bacterium]
MKQKIHPKYSPATIKCACGNEIKTASTKEKMEVELCSMCHPFYTGKQKLVDVGGRVERFKKRLGKKKTTKSKKTKTKSKKSTKKS